jgi:hypothetical protein
MSIRVDDPFSGPELARVVPGQRVPTAGVDGVHDLYLVYGSVGTTVEELDFAR